MESAKDPNVAGFKSVVCYRTGLDVSAVDDSRAASTALMSIYLKYRQSNVPLRLADKPVNDFVVRMALEVAAEHNKPGMDPASSYFLFLHLTRHLPFTPFTSCSTVSYRSWRRRYHVGACEPGPPAASDRSKPSDHVRAAARQLSVYARGGIPYGGV